MLFGPLFRAGAMFALIVLPACGGGASSNQVPGFATNVNSSHGAANSQKGAHRSGASVRAFAADCVWNGTLTGVGNCTNIRLAGNANGAALRAEQVPGLHPADLQAAYQLPSATAGTGQTIGIVIPYDDPNVQGDLAVYRSTFGLPACSAASGCLRVIAPKKVPANPDWSRELSIDVDMASAVCPNCKLLVVEANSSTDKDLAQAIGTAIAAGANVVSNSYVIPESPQETKVEWPAASVPIVAAAGDQGFSTANWPAASPNVIAVGATTLLRDGTTPRGWRELSWSGTGSACSTIAPKPAWQTDTGCAKRIVADVAAVGDPATPVAVYDTYEDTGWIQMGGSSVATPLVAGVYALAGNGTQVNAASSLYSHRGALFAIDAGSNGNCMPYYLCTAGGGYSGPTGLGSPNGIGAF